MTIEAWPLKNGDIMLVKRVQDGKTQLGTYTYLTHGAARGYEWLNSADGNYILAYGQAIKVWW